MNEAIKLAIEKGGYLKGPYWWPVQKPKGIELRGDDQDKEFRTVEQIILDPLFWQALCKAKPLNGEQDIWDETPTWIFIAKRWFNSRLKGKEDEFWESILPKTAYGLEVKVDETMKPGDWKLIPQQ